jgi:putative DNA methylase
MKRKLIEVALPLETINRESANEKSVPRKGHPATLHLWWARRPLAAARAVLFAQLVDDPSARADEFPTEEAQRIERERLHRIIERLVVWDNIRDEKLFAEAHQEILKSTNGNPPAVLDPFAGGGTIPLEAQRLGLEAFASDLNPVPVLINKALLEIPPRFHGKAPIFPGLADSEIREWQGTQGLAADVRAYGAWMREESYRRIGHLYPSAAGNTVVGWVWTRTVTCPNPACRIEMPLVRSWWLARKKGKETYVVPSVVTDPSHPSGFQVRFAIGRGAAGAPQPEADGTVGRTGATCVACKSAVALKYVRSEGVAGRMNQRLMAIVAEGNRSRIYLPPDEVQLEAANAAEPRNVPDADIPDQALGFRVQAYGMTKWTDLFSRRQLVALTTFSDLVIEARARVIADGGSPEYADAIATYLGFLMSKLADWLSAFCSWMAPVEKVRDTFARQAIPMVWDFMEINPFSNSVGNASAHFEWIVAALETLPPVAGHAVVRQGDAKDLVAQNAVISTDPPYYDNIGYSDLSDYFYVWLRRTLRDVHPEVLGTVLVPKAAELVANPFRHNGKEGAKRFFEDGFREVFARARETASPSFPMTVYYAFRQSETDSDGESSSGWETLLEGMIRSGWEITSTWPMRSERGGRMISVGTNALASSIVLSLRPRSESAHTTDRRGLILALQAELPGALRRLQQGAIAPVDLPQAAIGPGMAVFSRYSKVLEPDGSQMTVRSALARINEILDQVLSEQEGDFDSTTRFALAWYRQHGYNTGTFGDADNLARARNTSVERMDRDEIVTSRAGKVTLIKPSDTPADYDLLADNHTSSWEALHHTIRALETEGVLAAGSLLAAAQSRSDGRIDLDLVKELAFLLFSIAEKNGWTKDAVSFNTVAQSWGDVVDASKTPSTRGLQGELDLLGDEY